MPDNTTVATRACLLAMRDLLKKYGWVRGEYGSCERGFCLLGAYSKACLNHDIAEHHFTEPEGAKWAAPLEVALGKADISFYNDYKAKSAEEVIQLLETRAAALPA